MSEYLAELTVQLSAQDMEVVGRRRDVHNLPVIFLVLADQSFDRKHIKRNRVRIFVTTLQKPFQATTAVLRTSTLVPMRQQHHEARLAQPLRLACRDELVDDDLSTIDEVTELRLPQNKGIRRFRTVAKLEPKDTVFGQQRVGNLKLVWLVRLCIYIYI